jgi:nucleoside-triphosphatase THEP1
MKSAYLIKGLPGAGKNSLIKQALVPSNIKAGGFFGEVIRVQGTRQGFRHGYTGR